MKTFMFAKEAAELWNLSEKSVLLMCSQGSIPGAVKINGTWYLPEDTVPPALSKEKPFSDFHPEKLYGKNTNVIISSSPSRVQGHECGCAMTKYEVIEGVSLVFHDIYEEKLCYESSPPEFPNELIAIQHCREGRFEGEYPNGECMYMGPGSLSVNLPSCSPVINSFPLRHYRGFYIAILPNIAEKAIESLEKIMGPLQIDFSIITSRLSAKNKLAVYSLDEKTSYFLASFYPGAGEFHEERLKLQVLELLQLLCRKSISPPRPQQYFTRDQVKTVKEIRQYLICHIDQHIPLPQLADKFHISLTAMKTCFKGVYGNPIGKYLRDYRMHSGAEQLCCANIKIIEIASSLGYENAGKFSETFKEYYGVTPSEYRKHFCPLGLPYVKKG